jgi:sulfide:quinone oxidoreductase
MLQHFLFGRFIRTSHIENRRRYPKQTSTGAANLLPLMEGKPIPRQYEGYTSCPLITGYGIIVLAEFDYQYLPMETFPFDQSKVRWSVYQLKKEALPRMYWSATLIGKMNGLTYFSNQV